MENPETYYWIYLTIFIVFVVVIVGGITVYNKTTEKWKVLTMDDEGDLVYATVPGITEAPLDPKLLELDGNLGVTSKIHANQLEIDDTSNFKGKTTFKGELHVENDLENTNTEKRFTWGDVEIYDGVLNSPKVKTGRVGIGGAIDNNKQLKVTGDTSITGTLNAGSTTVGKLCIGSTCIEEKHLKILLGQQKFLIRLGNDGIKSTRGNRAMNASNGGRNADVRTDNDDDYHRFWYLTL
jgi:hypothetical protein